MISLTLPIKTISEANRASHEHWVFRHKRSKHQRLTTALAVRPLASKAAELYPAMVQITRIAPRALDSDNLAGSQKAIRDGITDALGLPSDRDERVLWRYAQRRGKPREYAVLIEIFALEQRPAGKEASDG